MAIKFKLIRNRDKGGMKYYPQVINNGSVTFEF